MVPLGCSLLLSLICKDPLSQLELKEPVWWLPIRKDFPIVSIFSRLSIFMTFDHKPRYLPMLSPTDP